MEYVWLMEGERLQHPPVTIIASFQFSVTSISVGGKHPVGENEHHVRNAKHLIKGRLASLKCRKTLTFDYLERDSGEKFMTTRNSFQIKSGTMQAFKTRCKLCKIDFFKKA